MESLKRGDILTISLKRDYGKPRPAVVVQSDNFVHSSAVIVCPFTSQLNDAPLLRITVDPSKQNGLRVVSQIMVDKIYPVRREQTGETIGMLDDETMLRLNRSLIAFLDLT